MCHRLLPFLAGSCVRGCRKQNPDLFGAWTDCHLKRVLPKLSCQRLAAPQRLRIYKAGSHFFPALFYRPVFVMSTPVTRSLSSRLARFAKFECTADLSNLSRHEHSALQKLVRAAKCIDQVYLRQAWSGNEALQKKLHEQGDKELCELFRIYKGPWVSTTPRRRRCHTQKANGFHRREKITMFRL